MADFMNDSTYTSGPGQRQQQGQQSPYGYPNFSQLQRQGQARPPMPQYTQASGYYANPAQPQSQAQPVAGRPQPVGSAQEGYGGYPGGGNQPGQYQPMPQGWQPPAQPPALQPQPQQPPPAQPPGGTGPGVNAQPTVPGSTGGGGINQQMQDFVTNWMQNTNPYNQQVAKDIYNSLNTASGHEFDIQRQLAQEQSARQGFSSSTLAQGRQGDIGIRQGEASTALAAQIAQQSAMTNSQSMQAAMNAALGLSQNNFNQEYQTNLFNSGQDQYYQNLLNMLLGNS